MNKISDTQHEFFLREALTEAKKRRGFCAPHPAVGAVVVHQGQIISQAHHEGPGHAHAEAKVLQSIPPDLDNLYLYVTLEPCNHWGKTPPCVKAILDYGVKVVVYAYHDPHIHVPENVTRQILEKHGVEVIYYPIPEIDAFYSSYHYWVEHQMPVVTAKWAQSFNSKVGNAHQKTKLTNSAADNFTHHQRLYADVILTSAQTILCDNPKLNVRLESKPIAKDLAVLDGRLRLTGKEQCFQTARQVFIFHDASTTPSWAKENVSFYGVAHNGFGLDLKQVCQKLGVLGIHDVWLEAGPSLMTTMHQLGLVKKTHIFLTPHVLASDALDAFKPNYHFFSTPFQLQTQQMDDNILTTFTWQDE
jgi:diaminohydroxyphosphoribosylaminopyrimidine deaminase/5-amino-6-(5-phosphoribosylamino)uracil reductase